MCPPWERIVQVFDRRKLHKIEDENALKFSAKSFTNLQQQTHLKTHETNARSSEDPAELPPAHWVVTNHVLDTVVESLDAEAPRNWNALEKDQEKKTKTADSIRVEDLEDVHATLRDARQTHKVADKTNTADEKFLTSAEKLRPFIDHGSNETFHRAELRVETNKKQHEEEETWPKCRTR